MCYFPIIYHNVLPETVCNIVLQELQNIQYTHLGMKIIYIPNRFHHYN